MKSLTINYKKINPNAKEPYKKHDVDAGFDLTAIWKKEEDKYIEYGTGLSFEIPEGYVGLLFPRSSVTKMDLILKNSVGVIDASYRGEIVFRFNKIHNDTVTEYNAELLKNVYKNYITTNSIVQRLPDYYKLGDRIGQIVFIEIPKIKLNEVTELSETQRGNDGFGSSGK